MNSVSRLTKWILFGLGLFALAVILLEPNPSDRGPKALGALFPLEAKREIPVRLPGAREFFRPKTPAREEMSPLDAAADILAHEVPELRIQPHHRMIGVEFATPLGSTVIYRFEQEGISIAELEVRVEMDKDKNVRSIHNGYLPVAEVDLRDTDRLTPLEVIEKNQNLAWLKVDPTRSGPFADQLIWTADGATAVLAYSIPMMDVRSGNSRPVLGIFNAKDGTLLSWRYPFSESAR